MSHPSKDIISSKGREMAGRKIALLVTSSVASFKAPEIARELMRHGADVYAVISPSTEKMIGADLLEWATGNPVVTHLTGKLEHIALGGKSEGHADVVLVAPATANTIGKLASGIDDTPVTTVAATAIGSRIPVMIAPAMHEPLYDHPIVQENISRLKKIGVEFIEPEVSEGKAKIASTEKIVRSIIARFSTSQSRDLEGRRVLVTAGPTIEHIDPVRVVTNRSSGKMGVAIAEEVASRGADTTLILGPGTVNPPSGIRTIRVESTGELLEAVLGELKRTEPDLVFAAGAPTDYRPVTVAPKKIKTREKPQINLELRATPKILEEIRRASPKTFLVAFKTEHKVSNEELIDEAFKIIHEKNADLVAANDVGLEGVGFQAETTIPTPMSPLPGLQSLAEEYGVVVVGGAFYEKVKGQVRLSSPVIGEDGEIIGRQFKVHLFRFERKYAEPGSSYPVFEVKGYKIGILVCYDVDFPEPSRLYALNGVELILCPSRIVKPGIAPWQQYVTVRCLENRIPIVAPNVYAPPWFNGHSMIISLREDPRTKISFPKIASISRMGEGIAIQEIDLSLHNRLRRERFADRRPETYN